MRNLLFFSKLLFLTTVLLFSGTSLISQAAESKLDSVLQLRHLLLQAYNVSLEDVGDSTHVNFIRINRAANDLIQLDNGFIDHEVQRLIQTNDSLLRISSMNETSLQQQGAKIRNYENVLLLTAAVGAVAVVLFLVFMTAFFSRGSRLKKQRVQYTENERLIQEYRKRVNELQNDIDNCRAQAKTLVNENSQMEKQIGLLTEEIHKARDAGWLSESAQVSHTEKIRSLENQLSEEKTKKRILEEELLLILRKLRGEEE